MSFQLLHRILQTYVASQSVISSPRHELYKVHCRNDITMHTLRR